MSTRSALAALILGLALSPLGAAHAHHEAIFGPHSSLVLSSPHYVSLQGFTRQQGTAGARTQETTLLLSGGVSPWKGVPLSFSVILPASNVTELDADHSDTGLEDLIVGARYRLDLAFMQEALEREGNFAMGMFGLDFPTGSIDDHHGGGGGRPMDLIGAVTLNAEWDAFTGLLYAFNRWHGNDRYGNHEGNILFVGGGLGWTPWMEHAEGRSLSVQLGWSWELYRKNREEGVIEEETGGNEWLLHPTVVVGPADGWLVFAMASLPIARNMRDASVQDRWRVGAGVMMLFGHEHDHAEAAPHEHGHDAHGQGHPHGHGHGDHH